MHNQIATRHPDSQKKISRDLKKKKNITKQQSLEDRRLSARETSHLNKGVM